MFYDWTLNGIHENAFVLVDGSGGEVSGLGGTFTLEIAKAGGAFAASAGTKDEISDGWYRYTNVSAEADTIGPVAIRVTGAGIIQQNLLAVVRSLQVDAVAYPYTVTNSVTTFPVPGVKVWITTDLAGANIIYNNLLTDTFGVARLPNGDLPLLDFGTYYFWKHKIGVIDDDNPDIEVVGP